MLNYGDMSNYIVGDAVEFNITCDADQLVIEGSGTVLSVPANQIATITRPGGTYKIYSTSALAPDRYTAYCIKNGVKSQAVHFAVVQLPAVRLTAADGSALKRIALKPLTPDGDPLTKTSACLFNEDGTLNSAVVKIALSDGSV